jgi:DNA-binding MarR family transcriptional regulator
VNLDSTQDILNQLRALVQVLRNVSSVYEQKLGLSSAQVFLLRALRQKSPSTVNELAVATKTHQSSVSAVVQKLAVKKYVRVTPSPQDRRKKMVSLTEKGRAVLRRLPHTVQERLIANIETLGKRKTTQLKLLLDQVLDNLDVSRKAPSMFLED